MTKIQNITFKQFILFTFKLNNYMCTDKLLADVTLWHMLNVVFSYTCLCLCVCVCKCVCVKHTLFLICII